MATPAGKPYITEGGLTLQSRPYWKLPALIPTMVGLLLGWAVATVLAYYSVLGLITQTRPDIAAMVLVVSAIMAACLILYTRHYIVYGTKKHTLVVTDALARLMISERNYHIQASMPIEDIDFVEYFTPRDQAALIFHGKDNRIIEVPVWSMTDNPSAVVEFLRNKGIAVVQL